MQPCRSVQYRCTRHFSRVTPLAVATRHLRNPQNQHEHQHRPKLQRVQVASEKLATEDEEEGEELEQLSEARHIIVEKNFLEIADQLRGVFDQRFQDPRNTHKERFLWDYWHVPDQYTLIRTQAQVYFPQALYEKLEDALLAYGENVLGCRAITPVWLSYYVDGCSQELHTDSPHGPFAFVLSLTPNERQFRGGETVILQPHVLQYWEQYDASKGLEMKQLTTLIEPLFNQLLVFDPRFPHGVRPVSGTRDPREARLVLHGWFTEPSPFFTGALTSEQAEGVLNSALDDILEELQELPPATGVLTLRLHVDGRTGQVKDIAFLADTLTPLPGTEVDGESVRAMIQHCVHDRMKTASFPRSRAGDTHITYPMIFE